MKETAYLLQAALIVAWWAGLATNQIFFDAFQYEEIPPIAFWSFFAPDVAFIAALSVVRAYRNLPILEWVILGAFGYATTYCVNATILTNSGYLSTGLMAAGLAYNVFLCCHDSLFRSATTTFAQNILKTFIQILCIWFIALFIIPSIILDAFQTPKTPTSQGSLFAGSILFVMCSILALASSYVMVRDGAGTPLPLDQTNCLVIAGPYRYVRNPMAIAGIGQGIAISIIFSSVPILVYALLGASVWHFAIRPFEEQDLVRRFGDLYLEYRRSVSCWIPTFRTPGFAEKESKKQP